MPGATSAWTAWSDGATEAIHRRIILTDLQPPATGHLAVYSLTLPGANTREIKKKQSKGNIDWSLKDIDLLL